MPIILTADITSWRANQTLFQTTGPSVQGLRITKLALVSNTTTSAGTVSITAPSDNAVLYPPLSIAASIAVNNVLYTDEPEDALDWRDFAVSGLTATGTTLYLWYRP
jgi:hypothetical protein